MAHYDELCSGQTIFKKEGRKEGEEGGKEGREGGRDAGRKEGKGKGKRKKVGLDISKSNLNVMGSEIYETTELVVFLIYIRNIYINSDKNLEIKQFKALQTKTSCFYLG